MNLSDPATILAVWKKGTIDQNNDPAVWRKDACTAWMTFAQYGNRSSPYGWEIDHINPNGGDDLSNLRPLHWKNNVRKSDGALQCPVTSQGNKNVGV
jgi:hypothetical protein